jgi:hypothetical protein
MLSTTSMRRMVWSALFVMLTVAVADLEAQRSGGRGAAVPEAGAVGAAFPAAVSRAAGRSARRAPAACPMTPVIVGGYTYYQCGSTWYQPAYQGSQVTYVVVNPLK